MSCSNCQLNLKNFESSNRILCENHHTLCEICAVTAISECPLCGKSIYKMVPIGESNFSFDMDQSSCSNKKPWSNHKFLTSSIEMDEESPDSEVTLNILLEQYRINKDKIQAITDASAENEENDPSEKSNLKLFQQSSKFTDKNDSLSHLRISIDEINSTKDSPRSSEVEINKENTLAARNNEKSNIDFTTGHELDEGIQQSCIIIENCFVKISIQNGKLSFKSSNENINQQMTKTNRSNWHVAIDGSEGGTIKIDINETTSTATSVPNEMNEFKNTDNKSKLENISHNRIQTAHCPLVQNDFEFSKSGRKFTQLEFYPLKNDPRKLKAHTTEIKSAYEIIRDRSPFFCPITSCNYQPILVSDFAYHLHVEHQKLPFLTIMPGMYRNVCLEPKINKIGVNTCSMGLLLQNKIR